LHEDIDAIGGEEIKNPTQSFVQVFRDKGSSAITSRIMVHVDDCKKDRSYLASQLEI